MDHATSAGRPRGRPREFDIDAAVDQAVDVFRQRGYAGTSIVDLSSGMALTRGSLYKAFTDKKTVFLRAFDRYTSRGQACVRAIADGPGSARERIRKVLEHYLHQSAGERGRLGCLVVATATETTVVDAEIARAVEQAMTRLERVLRELVRAGVDDGSVAANHDPVATARVLLCLLQGMRLVGKSDAHRSQMHRSVVDAAMQLLG